LSLIIGRLSLTGLLLYPIVDRFVVHWTELHSRYPRSQLIETFIRHKGEEGEGNQLLNHNQILNGQ